jgi:uncharacterized lipoprotein YajG
MKKIIVLIVICSSLLFTGCNKEQTQTLIGQQLNLSAEQLYVQYGNGQAVIIEDANVINEINNMIKSSDFMPVKATSGVGQTFTITWNDELKYTSTGYLYNKSQLYEIINKEVISNLHVYIQSNIYRP